MPSTVEQVLLYVLLPIVALVVGGIIATFRAPSPSLTSLFQHFAAGTVFAALAGELLPNVTGGHAQLPVVIGCAVGVALMLGVRYATENPGWFRMCGVGESSSLLLIEMTL